MNYDRVEIFREKLDNFTISDYHGLISPGLTCYLNSVLQVFFMTEDFRGSIKRCCSEDSATIDTLLRKLFNDLERRLAKTHNIIQTLGITDVYEQHDAAEYFEKILCLTSPEAAKVFKGELSHKTKCAECKKENNFRSSFWILPLAMENSYLQTYSLKRGLKAFFNKEKVCGENKMFCNQCNKKQDADIDCEMTQNPEILTLLLKRFTFDYKWDCYIKLHCEVDVPQTLHIENCEYDLYALVHHFGNLTGGHYTAEIKSFETGEWYHFNDDIVDRVRLPLFRSGNTSAKSCTAYLLMYRRVSTHPEKTDEISEEAQCSQVDEGSQDEAERGEAPVPRHQLKEERCPGDENLKHVNGDVLNEMTDNMDSEELETQPDQTAACVTPHEDIQRQTNTGADGDSLQTQKLYFSKTQNNGGHHEPNRHHLNTNSEQINSQKQSLKPDDITWDSTGQDSTVAMNRTKTKYITDRSCTRSRVKLTETKGVKNTRPSVAEVTIKQRTEADVRVSVRDSAVNSFHVSSNGCSQPAVLPWTRRSHSNCRMDERMEYHLSSSPCRSSTNLKRHSEKMQQVVMKGEKATSPRKTKNTKKNEETVKQEPWR